MQIDPVTVKNLDKNLFLSDEIREVYREIMKTVPSDHLNLDHVSQRGCCSRVGKASAVLSNFNPLVALHMPISFQERVMCSYNMEHSVDTYT